MKIFERLNLYLMNRFFMGFVSAYATLGVIVLLFNTVELMRRAAGRDYMSFQTVFGLSLLGLPQIMESLMPFVFLFGAMMVFWRLNRSNELVIIRTGGVSVWQFLKPAFLVALFWGVLQVALFNPFSAAMTERYNVLSAKYFEQSIYQSFISTDGLWLRQNDDTGTVILHAGIVNPDFSLRDITAFFYDENYDFAKRVDADAATLIDGQWIFDRAVITDGDGKRKRQPEWRLNSNLTVDKIQESFSPPESLSIWRLPDFITVLEKSGFSALSHRLYFHELLATPFTLMSMILLAACFSITPQRQKRTLFLISGGILSGFIYYTFSDIVHALGGSGRIPILLSAWAPFFVAVFFGSSFLLHQEDG